jgi:hypothetical protein
MGRNFPAVNNIVTERKVFIAHQERRCPSFPQMQEDECTELPLGPPAYCLQLSKHQ